MDDQREAAGGLACTAEMLQRWREHLPAILHASPLPMMSFVSWREDGRISDFVCHMANPAAGAAVGREPAGLVGRRLLEEMPGNLASGLFDLYVALVETGVPLRVEHHYAFGSVDTWFDIRADRFGDGFIVVLHDISNVKRAEQQARHSAERLHALLDTAFDGVITIDTAQRIVAFNRSAEQCFGVAATEIAGQPLSHLLPADARARHARLVERFSQGPDRSMAMGVWRLVRARHSSGREFPILAAVTRQQQDGVVLMTVVFRDMTETERQERERDDLIAELIRQRALAEEANLSKSRFLAKVSHELRTPLNAVIGFSEIMNSGLMGVVEPPLYRSYVADILSSGRHLLALIDDILDISRIESGNLALAPDWLDLEALFAEVRRMVEVEAQRRQVTVAPPSDRPAGLVWADQRALRQILINLVINAVRYGGPGCRVALEVDRQGEMVCITVADSGPGIPPALVARIGEPFIGEHHSHVRAGGGTGLGLAIVKALAEAHGGRLEVASGPDGTRLTLVLPQPTETGAGSPSPNHPTPAPAAA